MTYTEDQKASALAALQANDGNVKKTAKFLGIPEPTLRKWKNGQHLSTTVVQKYDVKKADLADLYEQVTRDILASISREDIATANLSARMTGAGIATDKMQLLREKPTAITGQYADPDARRARIAELLEQRERSGVTFPPRIRESGESATIN